MVGAATLQEVLVRLQELLKEERSELRVFVVDIRWSFKLHPLVIHLDIWAGEEGGGAIAINMTIDFVCIAGPNAR